MIAVIPFISSIWIQLELQKSNRLTLVSSDSTKYQRAYQYKAQSC